MAEAPTSTPLATFSENSFDGRTEYILYPDHVTIRHGTLGRFRSPKAYALSELSHEHRCISLPSPAAAMGVPFILAGIIGLALRLRADALDGKDLWTVISCTALACGFAAAILSPHRRCEICVFSGVRELILRCSRPDCPEFRRFIRFLTRQIILAHSGRV